MRNAALVVMFFLLSCQGKAYDSSAGGDEGKQCSERYTFSWPMVDDCSLQPRGGTTRGAPIELDANSSEAWLELQQADISDFERDRRAILAMAGPYRTRFEFLEVLGFEHGHAPTQPYQSWGTEYVYVLEDSGDFISLQHIMVMYFAAEEGDAPEPMVMKHWRQDWQYEKRELLEYQGSNSWAIERYSKKDVKGAWSQAVYQVDDSPRFEAFGRWRHSANLSSWRSEITWRPLPRRERTVRDDYNVLEGENVLTILPTGWVHEQANHKFALATEAEHSSRYVAKEIGLNRYDRIVNHDFSPGDRYRQETADYWADVRLAWQQLVKADGQFTISSEPSMPMFMPMFEGATKFGGENYDSEQSKHYIGEVLRDYLQ